MTVCGVGITDGWLATLVTGGSLVLLLGLLAWSAEWAQQRYEHRRMRPIIRTRVGLPAEPIEEVEDD